MRTSFSSKYARRLAGSLCKHVQQGGHWVPTSGEGGGGGSTPESEDNPVAAAVGQVKVKVNATDAGQKDRQVRGRESAKKWEAVDVKDIAGVANPRADSWTERWEPKDEKVAAKMARLTGAAPLFEVHRTQKEYQEVARRFPGAMSEPVDLVRDRKTGKLYVSGGGTTRVAVAKRAGLKRLSATVREADVI